MAEQTGEFYDLEPVNPSAVWTPPEEKKRDPGIKRKSTWIIPFVPFRFLMTLTTGRHTDECTSAIRQNANPINPQYKLSSSRHIDVYWIRLHCKRFGPEPGNVDLSVKNAQPKCLCYSSFIINRAKGLYNFRIEMRFPLTAQVGVILGSVDVLQHALRT